MADDDLGVLQPSHPGLDTLARSADDGILACHDAGHVYPHAASTLEVGGRRLTARRIFLNVGGRAVRPDLSGIDSVPTLDNASIMGLDHVPEHLVIVGGSYIGLEFAQVMRRFGAEVTVVERSSQLLPREDADVSDGIRTILENEGVHFAMGSECLSLAKDGGRIVVGAACGSEQPVIVGSHVLLAVGRRPNTDGLGLDVAGVQTDARGYITVDDQCRTSAEGVWAVGDCNGRGAFTHTSWNDHEVVVANLFDNDLRRISDRFTCYALFIDPALGRVGMTETEALASGKRVLRAKMPMQRVGRAREAGETQGFMKVLVDADSQLLIGAAILGLNGDEVVHGLLDVMAARQPYTVISRSVPIHPTVSELLPTLLQQLKPMISAASGPPAAGGRMEVHAPDRVGGAS
jgi:pyruvate/2-oxoglutarate dehydrogenase complex dihydrolipoamide dehydrogenase (E3) component